VDEIIGFKRPSTLNLVVPCGNAWVANNNYAIGDYIHANGNIYVCTTAGTSAIEGSGPSETGTGITDGSVVWNYVVAFTGMITCNDSNWGFVATENAYSAKARWVYVQAIIDGNELPLVSYREIGLYSALQVAEGVGEDSAVLLPAQVANNGVLEVISYRKPIPRSDDQKDQLSLVLAF
jgi:hypothetical protein